VVTQTMLHRRETTPVRLCLEPREPTPWHRDPCHRLTLVLRGADLAIEYRDGDPQSWRLRPTSSPVQRRPHIAIEGVRRPHLVRCDRLPGECVR
jgi:hypothetical protein